MEDTGSDKKLSLEVTRELSLSIPEDIVFSRGRIIKNVIVLSIGFLIIFVAYDCMSMLQSTLNHEDGIGVICLAIVYFFYGLSAILLPKYVIKRLGSKVALIAALVFYLPYVASNLYPHWSFMIPTAIFNGLAASFLWGAQCVYLNKIAILYALHSAEQRKGSIINKVLSKKNPMKEISATGDNVKENTSGSANQTNKNSRFIYTIDTNITAKNTKENFDNLKESIPSSLQNRFLTDTDNSTGSKTKILSVNGEGRELELNKVRSESSASKSKLYKTIEFTTARFFGFHSMIYLSTHMWSNLMAYFVLHGEVIDTNTSINSTCVCGADFCNIESDCFINNLQVPSNETRFLLTYICIGMGLFSILFMAVFLDSLNDKEEVKFSFQILMATIKHSKKKTQILLIPLSFYIGMIQGFFTGEYTVAYVGCSWGTYHVGLVAACYGGACALSSGTAGWLVKRLGRIPIFMTSAVIGIADMILFLMWNPSADNPVMFFVTSGLWGASTGIIWSQLKAMYGILFKGNEEAAFASYHVWYSLGFCLSFAYSNHFCTYVKIYMLLAVSICGMFGYLWIELRTKHQIK